MSEKIKKLELEFEILKSQFDLLKKNHERKINLINLHSLSLQENECKLLKIKLQTEPFDPKEVEEQQKITGERLQISGKDAGYFAFTGATSITTYDLRDERINILFKDGTVRDISKVDNALIHQDLSSAIKKYYFCYYRW